MRALLMSPSDRYVLNNMNADMVMNSITYLKKCREGTISPECQDWEGQEKQTDRTDIKSASENPGILCEMGEMFQNLYSEIDKRFTDKKWYYDLRHAIMRPAAVCYLIAKDYGSGKLCEPSFQKGVENARYTEMLIDMLNFREINFVREMNEISRKQSRIRHPEDDLL